jgi:hypothetical protein
MKSLPTSRFSLLSLMATLLTVALGLSQAGAVPIANLYSTGVDNSNNALPTGSTDTHYFATSSPGGPFAPIVVSDAGWPFPLWVANNYTPGSSSRWIGPDVSSYGPAGNYVYRTTFFLPPSATNVVINGLWATDDWGTDILINGNSTGQVSAGFTSLVPFAVTSGFQPGPNSLDFLVTNAGGPTGLRVDGIRGKFDLIPEPATFLLAAGSGLLLIGRRIARRSGL